MPYTPPPELAALSLGQLADQVAARKIPPVDQWSPQEVGDSEMRIAADGRWYHQGGEIRRPAMVRAFSSLLIRDEDGQHWLVTPFQKLSIEVEDAAFIATDMQVKLDDAGREAIAFRLNSDDLVVCGPDHPLRVGGTAEVPAFYLMVRHGVEARLNRSTYGQLIDHALALGGDELAVESMGARFALVPAP
ncbi:MAG: hypothetical protein B7Y36_06745 [Novosphingobium sp. 28-62-57]|uniref:DUF1285 domain-containing protein n=1 Tax=unclassified Novosphingobium TaxID=2644732 RepID=UPI000BD26739|nr:MULTISPECIES: DUF1285 domain-containing protein [unclassified Novosphingobium]OYW51119.1 MAG: hypothetical protein B7Z34_02275 [Novosphingobium sp. 12-62-10]OYZ11060.1 MAG: hypothetical protein B7Y36_06745 [Novosphingobium sp. 28-62-57]OZA39118.1 MAG: hypothetical protein B7X92_03130 [Novosphingobium sp. 17-62-9]HQS69661.1 DUF1285 domain-containing protein [Novosphingobium sp.]